MDLTQTSVLVENSIRDLKVDPAACRGANPGQWSLVYRGSTVWIDVFTLSDNPNRWYFQIMSPLLTIPDKNSESFLQSIAEINHNLFGSWISKKDNWTYVMFRREAAGLDQNEVNASLDRVAIYCADYHGKLSFKFEGCWLPKDTRPTGNTGDT